MIDTFDLLSDEEAGKLIKTVFLYVNDADPIVHDRVVQIAFEPIKQSLKRDLEKWNDKKIDKSRSGQLWNLKRRHKDLYDRVCDEEISIDEALSIAQDRKTSQCDDSESQTSQEVANIAVSVSDSDSDIVSDSDTQEKVDETSSSIVPTWNPDQNLPDISWPDQEEIDRRKKVAKRNQKLVDGVKQILQDHGMAYKKHPTMENRQANQFFRAKDYLQIVEQYNTTPGEFALQLCRWAMEHDFWRGKVTNTVKLYDHRASIHNDCVAKFKKKTDWRKGL